MRKEDCLRYSYLYHPQELVKPALSLNSIDWRESNNARAKDWFIYHQRIGYGGQIASTEGMPIIEWTTFIANLHNFYTRQFGDQINAYRSLGEGGQNRLSQNENIYISLITSKHSLLYCLYVYI